MKTPWPEDIGLVARQRRIDLNLSQGELAVRTGVTRQWLSRFESAKADVGLSKVLAVLRDLELDIDVNAPAPTATGTQGEAAMRSIAEVNSDLMEHMDDNIRRAMVRSGMSESAKAALDSLTTDPAYLQAIERLVKAIPTPIPEIPTWQDRSRVAEEK